MRRTSTAFATSAIRAWQAVAPAASRAFPTRLAGIDASHAGHVELDRLGRYLAVFALGGACLLINVWSRIDLRQTSVELHRAAASFELARAENARLQLELATLRDPTRLHHAATTLGLDRTVPVVQIPAR